MNGIQALITLAVGICTVVALTRKQPPIETTIRSLENSFREEIKGLQALLLREIGDIYQENKRDRQSTERALRDNEGRVSKLEGICQSRNTNGSNCVKL